MEGQSVVMSASLHDLTRVGTMMIRFKRIANVDKIKLRMQERHKTRIFICNPVL